MKGAKIYVVMGMAILALGFAFNAIASAEKEAQAEAAAKTWLALIDEGYYGASWETAAGYFKNAITKEKWAQTLSAVRQPLGALVSREVSSKTYLQSLPGAPDGEYMVILFKTSFKNKKSGVETVTPMLDTDGSWRVSGYYIK